MQRITAKLGNMRKAVEWTVYPLAKSETYPAQITIQSDHRIAQIDTATGVGLLSAHKASGAYFMHLSKFMGATWVQVPREVIDAAVAAQPKSGDAIGPGVVVA